MALGKGLSALIEKTPKVAVPGGASTMGRPLQISVKEIVPDPNQPRRTFADGALTDLVDSIRDRGVLNPLLLRKKDGKYQIIAGERRYRAAIQAGLSHIPASVLEIADDKEAFVIGIIDNIIREDLNPIEEAQGYQRLIEEFHLTQEEVAQSVRKDRSTITNSIRLLKLPELFKEDLITKKLTTGHARAALGLDKVELFPFLRDSVISGELSVRKTEDLVRKLNSGKIRPSKRKTTKDAHVVALEEKLSAHLGVNVKIVDRNNKGRIEIGYKNVDEFQKILDKLSVEIKD